MLLGFLATFVKNNFQSKLQSYTSILLSLNKFDTMFFCIFEPIGQIVPMSLLEQISLIFLVIF